MQYVVCYDIADEEARRDRVAKALLDFGQRVQESVFVANLDEELAARMVQRLQRLVDPERDRLHVFALCSECSRKTQVFGVGEKVEDRPFYVI
jgi:CRISPR-associated protein Cas2